MAVALLAPPPPALELSCSVSVCGQPAAFEGTVPDGSALYCDGCAGRAQAMAVILDVPMEIRRLDTGEPIADIGAPCVCSSISTAAPSSR